MIVENDQFHHKVLFLMKAYQRSGMKELLEAISEIDTDDKDKVIAAAIVLCTEYLRAGRKIADENAELVDKYNKLVDLYRSAKIYAEILSVTLKGLGD